MLDVQGNSALLLSRYGLDTKCYSTLWGSVTWETCTLRSWLNGQFLKKAFTAQEQMGILMANVDNSSSQGCGIDGWSMSGGNNTQDKIFLLSAAEAKEYLGVTFGVYNNMKPRTPPTAYAKKAGALCSEKADGSVAGFWWLRSPGSSMSNVCYVGSAGGKEYCDADVMGLLVRPALWINLESGFF